MSILKIFQKKAPLPTTNAPSDKRRKSGQFGKNNHANDAGRPKKIKVESPDGDDGFLPLIEVVKRSAMRGSVRHQEMYLKYSGRDAAPAVIHIYIPRADPMTYGEGDFIPPVAGDFREASMPPWLHKVASDKALEGEELLRAMFALSTELQIECSKLAPAEWPEFVRTHS